MPADELPPLPPTIYSQSHAAILAPIKEALFHSRLDHPGRRYNAAHARLDKAEKALADVDALLRKCGCK